MRNESIFEAMAKDINNSNLSAADKQRMMTNLAAMRSQKMTQTPILRCTAIFISLTV